MQALNKSVINCSVERTNLQLRFHKEIYTERLLNLFMCKYWMIVTMLHWFIKELITKHPSDASELIKASCHGFRFA